MKASRAILPVLISWLILAAESGSFCLAQPAAPAAIKLPDGVRAVWDLDKAFRQKTPTREQVCINGLWRWQPADKNADKVPAANWGYFKVPGSWPGITDYMHKDCQTVFADAQWNLKNFSNVASAWYQRQITIPAEWGNRRIVLRADYVNSFAAVHIDGKKVGEIVFPSGELEITPFCRPGGKYELSLLVVPLPLEGVMLSYSDSASAKEVKGSVERRGLCGDVFLIGEPAGPRITDVRVDTSVRKWEITFNAGLTDLPDTQEYALHARLSEGGKPVAEFTSDKFKGGQLVKAGSFTAKWKTDKLWDTVSPQNMYQLDLSLESGGKVLDAALPVRFGFREFWIDGKDFYLNGSRIYLSCVPFDNAGVGAAWSTYDAAMETLKRLKSFGINFVYTHNYGCEPGSHLGFSEILRAADDAGVLVSFSQPHFGHYKWKAPDADVANGYARHAEFYVRAAGSHPSIVFYSMSHNATGYAEDMNPDMIDGKDFQRDTWSLNNTKLALRAEAIVRHLDPARIVYHHSSGNLGSMHDMNFYPNWAPIQEMSDWFEHWSREGVKPAFTCEYGAPFGWDWTMYRGWYKGERSFGSARVPWEFCFAEWNAQFLGDKAFAIGEPEKANLRWETKQFRDGKLWYRWDYPYEVGSKAFDDRYAVFAMYINDNWRAFRTLGLSANSPWEHSHFWRPRPDLERNKLTDLKVDWDNLQRPGFSPDYLKDRFERMDLAYDAKDWVATPAAEALIRNNGPLLAYIAGSPEHITGKDHNFLPGQKVARQIIVINNSRRPTEGTLDWTASLPTPISGKAKVALETGQQKQVPLEFDLPKDLPPGPYEIKLSAVFDKDSQPQTDRFVIHVLPEPLEQKASSRIALLDPKGQTAHLLESLGVKYQAVQADADLSAFDVLIIGKGALTSDSPGPNVDRVRDGLKVVMFEQTSDVLEKRFGFRVVEYGLRNVFERVSDHPALEGLAPEHLRDWRGESTITSPRLKYEMRPMHGPTVKWCGIDVTRVWRCGNWGNVASVLIEKPARGDFLPILDGGFNLQYSPLMEFRQGKGMIIFCQMDVTGRSFADPAAGRLARNIIRYACGWKSPATAAPKAYYAGVAAGKEHLLKAGVSVEEYGDQKLTQEDIVIAGPGINRKPSQGIASMVKDGGRLIAVGLDQSEAQMLIPQAPSMKQTEHIASYFQSPLMASTFAGIGPADVHNRDPRKMPLVTGGAEIVGDGVLAASKDGRVVFFQMPPWTFDYRKQYNVKRTFRRASFALSRVLAGMGVESSTPVLERFKSPAKDSDKRWLDGLYLDEPEEMDDPYRFFRW